MVFSLEFYEGILVGSRIYEQEERDELGTFSFTTIAIYIPFIVLYISYISNGDLIEVG